MERNRRVHEVVELNVALDDLAQTACRDKVVALPGAAVAGPFNALKNANAIAKEIAGFIKDETVASYERKNGSIDAISSIECQ